MTTTNPTRIACDCGSIEFYVDETIGHKADIHEGKLIVTDRDWTNEVARIYCQTCDATYPLDDFDHSELF